METRGAVEYWGGALGIQGLLREQAGKYCKDTPVWRSRIEENFRARGKELGDFLAGKESAYLTCEEYKQIFGFLPMHEERIPDNEGEIWIKQYPDDWKRRIIAQASEAHDSYILGLRGERKLETEWDKTGRNPGWEEMHKEMEEKNPQKRD